MAKLITDNREIGYTAYTDCTRSEAIQILKKSGLYLDKNQKVCSAHEDTCYPFSGTRIYRGYFKQPFLFIWEA